MGILKTTNANSINNKAILYKNFIEKNFETIGLFDSLERIKIDLNDIMNYINSQNPEISLTGIILLIAKYEKIFGRNYMTKFFYFKELGEYPRNEDMLWDLHTYNNKFIYISENQNEILTKINTKIYNNFKLYYIKI